MQHKTLKNTVLSAMFLCIGLVLPFLTGQIREIGNMLLPMHIPVFLCGLICGWPYGLAVGFILPLLRSALFSMPAMYPNAVSMAFELATYGLVVGLCFRYAKKQRMRTVYTSMLIAMLAGRLVWGAAQVVLLGLGGKSFAWSVFLANGFINAIPGIILQLLLIPAVMLALHKSKLIEFKE